MATYDVSAIRAAIKAVLLTIAELGTNVYDYNNPAPAGYPCAVLDMTNEDAQMLDEVSNLRTVQFTVSIFQEIPVAGEQAAKALLDAAVTKVFAALESKTNENLGGTVDWTLPVTGRRTHTPSGDGGMYMQEVILNARVASTRT